MVTRCANIVSPTVNKIGKILVDAYLMHCDETGTRVDGKTKWVHVACNKFFTYLFIHNSLNDAIFVQIKRNRPFRSVPSLALFC